jgi:two-component system OmpR family response regulator
VTYTVSVQVLVVDDHAATRQLLSRNLQLASYGVKTAGSCEDAEDAIVAGIFDVVVLDVMLPDGSGIDLCRRLRATKHHVPILLLTARGEVRDRVVGLEAGADDYLIKPFALSELMARVKALGRRGPILRDSAATFGSVVVDFEARRVSLSGRDVPLTAKELAIVEVLAWRRGAVVSRDQLIESVWGDVTDSATASLEVLVARIRRKLGSSAALLRTVRGVGYAFRCEE